MTPIPPPAAHWRWLRALAALALVFTQLAGTAQPAAAVSTSIVISQFQVAGATAADEFVELHNVSGSAVDLNGYRLVYRSAAGTSDVALVSWTTSTVVPAGSFYLIAGTPGYDDTVPADITFNGGTNGSIAGASGGFAIRNGAANSGIVIDSVGYGTATNAFVETATTSAPAGNASKARNTNGCADTDNNNADFGTLNPSTPRNSSSAVQLCGSTTAPSITTQPQSQTIASGQTATLSVVASGTAPLSYQWYQGSAGDTSTPVGSDSGSFTTPALSSTTSYWVRVSNAAGAADSATATITVGAPIACAAADVTIGSVQGPAETAAKNGQTVTVQGVVVLDYEGPSPALRGFYLQDAGDGDTATSDGIFVFEGDNANRVSVGQVVQVTGVAAENQGQTQISSTAGIEACGSTGSVAPTDIALPLASATALEAYEGMLVRFPQTLYVTEHFQLGRFGQVVMSSGGRLRQPTSVVAPGAPALQLQAQNDLNRIIVDDDTQAQNPDPIKFGRGGQPLSASNTLRGGDTASGMIGVMTYTWGGNSASPNAYRLRPIGALGGGVPDFQPANPRPSGPPSVGGSLRVVGMNLLNFFNTFDGLPDNTDNCNNGVGGAATDCRGADTQAEFDRQWPKTVAAILALDPDVVGVNEIENDGYGPDSAIQFLVNKLNTASAPGTYAFIDVDANTGQANALGSDAIKVGMIYKPAKVAPVGTTAVLNSVAFVNGGDSTARSRPSLAQAFRELSSGGRFIVDINHLKSKGSACDAPDAGDGQGNCNTVRANAATALVSWLASDPTGTGDPDILLIGDYNSYAKEDPITIIKNAGFTNLIETKLGPDAYSYVFDGQWGYLDHALGSASIVSQVAGVGDYHINSDEPSVLDYNTDFKTPNLQSTLYAPDQFRVSDHDPVLIGLNLASENHAPVASGQSVTTAEDTATAIVLGATDADGDPLTYAYTQPAHGSVTGSGPNVTYTPDPNYNGTDSFTFTASDGTATSEPATVSITVAPVNDAPTIGVAAGGACQADFKGQANLTIGDVESAAGSLTLTASSSNTSLVPAGNITLGGSGANRTVTIATATGKSGTAVVTINASDGPAFSTVTITVIAGTSNSDTLTGSAGADMIFAGGAQDTLTGNDGNDLLCGGQGDDKLYGNDGADTLDGGQGQDQLDGGSDNDKLSGGQGDDKLTGGSGADAFDGGQGNDTITDFTPAQGDTKVNVP